MTDISILNRLVTFFVYRGLEEEVKNCVSITICLVPTRVSISTAQFIINSYKIFAEA